MSDVKKVVLEMGGFQLIRMRDQWFIEDTHENTITPPLHHSLVAALLAYPSNLLDLRMACPTPRGEYVPAVN